MLQSQGSFIIHGQFIKDLSFESPGAPKSLMIQEQPQINISFDIKVVQHDDKTYEVITLTHVKATATEESLFTIELTYAGLFTVDIENPEELERVLLVQCPHYLFPYIRRIVADATRDGGYIPLMLQPIDFLDLYIQKKTTVNDNLQGEKSEKPH